MKWTMSTARACSRLPAMLMGTPRGACRVSPGRWFEVSRGVGAAAKAGVGVAKSVVEQGKAEAAGGPVQRRIEGAAAHRVLAGGAGLGPLAQVAGEVVDPVAVGPARVTHRQGGGGQGQVLIAG